MSKTPNLNNQAYNNSKGFKMQNNNNNNNYNQQQFNTTMPYNQTLTLNPPNNQKKKRSSPVQNQPINQFPHHSGGGTHYNIQNIQGGNQISARNIECYGESPLPRFGHTISMLNNAKMVLFGGAVGNTKNFKFSNETFIFNLITRMWIEIKFPPNTPLPKERAAHAAACNDQNQMIIHGGSGTNNELTSDELWMFDMRNNVENESTWINIKTEGRTPGVRYGHTISFMSPYFVLFGGNSNTCINNDVWTINLTSTQAAWVKLDIPENSSPAPRLYHTCGFTESGAAKGMIIIFGGRDQKENPLNDIWGLRRHRDGRWDWVNGIINQGEQLKPRYNHSVVFFESLMIIIGGRSRGHRGPLPIEVYDTEKSESFMLSGMGVHRQSSFLFDKDIYFYGGFSDSDQYHPLGYVASISLSDLFQGTPLYYKISNNENNNKEDNKNNSNNTGNNKLEGKDKSNNAQNNTGGGGQNNKKGENAKGNNKNNQSSNTDYNTQKNAQKKKFKLSNDVVVGSGGAANNQDQEQGEEDDTNLFLKISIDKLKEENKRIGETSKVQTNQLMMSKRTFNFVLINQIIETFLRPFDWYDDEKMEEIHNPFPISDLKIHQLLEEIKPVIEKENSLIRIRSPCKIFGNLYGQYNDLMRFFESFGNPSDDNQNGDIAVMQYIFLGDFCDRGYYSLEIILLLFALKVKYPDFIYIIRGHHEDKNVNSTYGLGLECKERLKDDITNKTSIFAEINKIFELLPLGILIDNNILCLHGGIGSSIKELSDIENISRPAEVVQNVSNISEQKILDILWSEYDENTKEIDVNNERGKGKYGFIVKYGKKRLDEFLLNNKLTLLITSHQYVQDGFTTFNDDKLLTLYSATNYMDQFKNVGAMITIAKKTANKPINIIPKLINVHDNGKHNYRSGINYSPIKKSK